jgi:RNA-directed DNA polymerase
LDETKIKHHTKVFGAYNPYDPDWELYGEQRLAERMSKDVWAGPRLTLWMDQGGRCVLCDHLLDSASEADDHHIVYRMHGGSNALANRVLLHPVCHRRVHALGLEVTKPASA